MRVRSQGCVVDDQVGCFTSTATLAMACLRAIAATDTHVAQVNPITTADYPTPAQRPSYSLLDCTASRKALDLPPTHWRQTLRQLLEAVA